MPKSNNGKRTNGTNKGNKEQVYDSVKIYFSEVSKYDLLDANEEIALGRIIQGTGEGNYFKAFEKMVNSNLRLVLSIALNYANKNGHEHLLDLIQEGNLGLIKAVEKYNPELGCRFSTYATWYIRQSVTRALRENKTGSSPIRVPIHEVDNVFRLKKARNDYFSKYGRSPDNSDLASMFGITSSNIELIVQSEILMDKISLDMTVGEHSNTGLKELIKLDYNPWAAYESADIKKCIEECLDELESRETIVLSSRIFENMSLQKIADVLSLSREGVRQIESRSLQKLKRKIIEKYPEIADDFQRQTNTFKNKTFLNKTWY